MSGDGIESGGRNSRRSSSLPVDVPQDVAKEEGSDGGNNNTDDDDDDDDYKNKDNNSVKPSNGSLLRSNYYITHSKTIFAWPVGQDVLSCPWSSCFIRKRVNVV